MHSRYATKAAMHDVSPPNFMGDNGKLTAVKAIEKCRVPRIGPFLPKNGIF
jgi:hypothetical protein